MEKLDKFLSQFSSSDALLHVRQIVVRGKAAAVVFNPDITDTETIRSVIYALEQLVPENKDDANGAKQNEELENIRQEVIYAAESKVKTDLAEVTDEVLSGDTLIILDQTDGYLMVGTRKWDKRSVSEPPAETVLKGPREGFIEDIKTNLSLLARRLKTTNFTVERMKIGRVSKTNVALCYISNIASPKTVKLIQKKLKSIDIDALIDASYIPPLIEPHPYSVFHQTGSTEKPDVAAAKLLEGRVCIVVDGSPTVITAPFLLIEDFQTAEDYYQRSAFVFFLRTLRYASIILAILLPGFYVAVQVFHFNVIPVKFLITLLNAVEGIPLSPLPEVLFVMLLFEIIREASVRMPRAVGMAMSIVGALVLGETAVSAGMISSPAVMIVALSSIALYTAPNDVGVVSLLRIMFVLIGGIGGLFALMMGILIILTILVGFDSFGTPYLAPFAPIVKDDLKDSIYRDSIINQTTRPLSIPNINRVRKG